MILAYLPMIQSDLRVLAYGLFYTQKIRCGRTEEVQRTPRVRHCQSSTLPLARTSKGDISMWIIIDSILLRNPSSECIKCKVDHSRDLKLCNVVQPAGSSVFCTRQTHGAWQESSNLHGSIWSETFVIAKQFS